MREEIKTDHVSILSAGVAFYFMLALFPALIAVVTAYGLVSDPADVERQVDALTRTMPPSAAEVIGERLHAIVNGAPSALGLGLVLSLLGALWTASAGCKALMEATNIAYDERETRGFLKLRGQAILFTVAFATAAIVALVVITGLPSLLGMVGFGEAGQRVAGLLRWPLLFIGVAAGFSAIYRYAPDRERPRWRWVTPGALAAAALWVLASLGFSFYASRFGTFGETYGALGGVIVLLLWLFLTAFVILIGAEIDSELEQQTGADSTTGAPRPLGDRGAVKADRPLAEAARLREEEDATTDEKRSRRPRDPEPQPA